MCGYKKESDAFTAVLRPPKVNILFFFYISVACHEETIRLLHIHPKKHLHKLKRLKLRIFTLF